MMYQVEVNGNATIVDAPDEKTAKEIGASNFISVRCHLATEQEIAWFTAMGGVIQK